MNTLSEIERLQKAVVDIDAAWDAAFDAAYDAWDEAERELANYLKEQDNE